MGVGLIRAQVKAALNATLSETLSVEAQHQRIAGHSIWPDPDFPRTHTLKVRRPEVERRLLGELLPQQAKDRSGAAAPTSS